MIWAYPKAASFKDKIREVFKDYNRFKSQAEKLSTEIKKDFSKEKIYDMYLSSILMKDFKSTEDVVEL